MNCSNWSKLQVETDQSATTRIKTDRNGSWRIETRLDGARESLQTELAPFRAEKH